MDVLKTLIDKYDSKGWKIYLISLGILFNIIQLAGYCLCLFDNDGASLDETLLSVGVLLIIGFLVNHVFVCQIIRTTFLLSCEVLCLLAIAIYVFFIR